MNPLRPRSILSVAPWSLALALLLVLLPGARASAQISASGLPYPRGQGQDSMGPMAGSGANAEMEAKRLEALNAARQKALVADTDKLLKLTAELNAQVNGAYPAGAHPASLTQAQLRMVAEIEKLAHDIREKMSTPLKGLPQMGPPPPLMMPPGMP